MSLTPIQAFFEANSYAIVGATGAVADGIAQCGGTVEVSSRAVPERTAVDAHGAFADARTGDGEGLAVDVAVVVEHASRGRHRQQAILGDRVTFRLRQRRIIDRQHRHRYRRRRLQWLPAMPLHAAVRVQRQTRIRCQQLHSLSRRGQPRDQPGSRP